MTSRARIAEVAGGPGCALTISGLSKTYAATRALSEVDLAVAGGEIHALVGHNGSGKSTLVKVLSGYVMPDPGARIWVRDAQLPLGSPHASFLAGCRFVHQDLGLVDSLPVLDNLLLTGGFPTRCGTIRARRARDRARVALASLGLGIDLSTAAGSLPAALRTGVAVARALMPDPRVDLALLVLDEPTATLPQTEVAHLLDVVRAVAARGIGVLFVSHHLDEVLEVADRVTVLRDGRCVCTRTAAGLTREQVVADIVGVAVEAVAVPVARRSVADTALEVRHVATATVQRLTFTVDRGEIVGIAGITGSGRDDVVPAIFGAIERSGEVLVGGRPLPPGDPAASWRAGIGLVPADRARHAAIAGLNARETVTLAGLRSVRRRGWLPRTLERAAVSPWLERLDVRPPGALDASIESFSGGNQQKLIFARALRDNPAVVLLDEPTQGVDVTAQARLHAEILGLAGAGAGVLVSSADTDELATLCSRVLVLGRGRVAAELVGDQVDPVVISRAVLGSTEAVAA